MTPEPQTPVDVRARYTNGTEIPLELVYTGKDERGIHHWLSTTPVNYLPGITITCAELPANTSIDLEGIT